MSEWQGRGDGSVHNYYLKRKQKREKVRGRPSQEEKAGQRYCNECVGNSYESKNSSKKARQTYSYTIRATSRENSRAYCLEE